MIIYGILYTSASQKTKISSQISRLLTFRDTLIQIIDFELKKLPTKSLHFQNLIIKDTMTEKDTTKNYLKTQTSKHLKKNNDNYNIVWMVNKTHTPFWTSTNFFMKNIVFLVSFFGVCQLFLQF